MKFHKVTLSIVSNNTVDTNNVYRYVIDMTHDMTDIFTAAKIPTTCSVTVTISNGGIRKIEINGTVIRANKPLRRAFDLYLNLDRYRQYKKDSIPEKVNLDFVNGFRMVKNFHPSQNHGIKVFAKDKTHLLPLGSGNHTERRLYATLIEK